MLTDVVLCLNWRGGLQDCCCSISRRTEGGLVLSFMVVTTLLLLMRGKLKDKAPGHSNENGENQCLMQLQLMGSSISRAIITTLVRVSAATL